MRALLLLMFFLSGAAALMYEVAWTRTMVLILGNTNLAMATVLAVFLLNFSFGSSVASRWGGKPASLLMKYGMLEAAIGLFGAAFPFLARLLELLYPAAAGIVEPQLVRLVLAWLILSIPTFLMGATFPLINGIYIQGGRSVSGQAAAVYASQTLGAAAGAAAAGFILIKLFGLSGTGYIAAALNVCLFLAALALRRRVAESPAVEGPELREINEGRAPLTFIDEARSSVIFAAVFCNAMAALVLEVLWTRILLFFLGSLTYSFAMVLVVYLLALGAGALILSLLGRRVELHMAAGSLILLLGGTAVCLGLCILPALYDFMQGLRGDPESYGSAAFFLSSFLGAMLVIFPGALLLGMVTPLAIGIQIRGRGSSCRESGLVYAAANLGACLGTMAAAWFLVPKFGLKMGVVISGFMVLAAGLLMLLFSRIRDRRKIVYFLAALGATWGLAVFMGEEGGVRHKLIFESHVFKRPGRMSHLILEDYREGNVCTASVVRDIAANERRLYVDAFNAASTGPAYNYMRMMAHLPVMACPHAERALVIGFGTGTTAGSLSLHEDLKSMEIVELSEAVMDVADHFSRENRGVGIEDKEGIGLRVGEDGREFLSLSAEGFDIITLEPMMPYTPGAVHFYTEEFYHLCVEKLKPRGALCHWIPLVALPAPEFKLLLSTFMQTLPGSACFLVEDSVLLLGFREHDWHLDLDRIQRIFESPSIRADLEIAGFDSSLSLSGAFIADGESMRPALDGAGIMSDDRTRIEYLPVEPSRNAYVRVADNIAFLRSVSSTLTDRLVPEVENQEMVDRIRRFETSSRLLMRGREAEARALYARTSPEGSTYGDEWKSLYEKAFYVNPEDRRAARKYSHSLLQKAFLAIGSGLFSKAHELTQQAAAIAPEMGDIYVAKGYLQLAAGNLSDLESTVELLRQVRPFSNVTFAFRAELACMKGEKEEEARCRVLLKDAGGLSPEEEVLMGRAMEALLAGEARYVIPSVERIIELLCLGPEGLTETGRRAWTVAESYDPELLEEAKEKLLLVVDPKREDLLSKVRGLGFFRGDDVSAALRELYRKVKGSVQGEVLESLSRTGDIEVLLEALSRENSVELLLKATQIACDLKIEEALGPLINLLDSDDPHIRVGAYVALSQLTNLNFNFDPYGPPEARSRALTEWRRWFEMRSEFEDR